MAVGPVQIPQQFDGCDDINTWTRTNEAGATNCDDIYTTTSTTYCSTPPCIILQAVNDNINCSSPKWITRTFNASDQYSLSIRYDIYINNFNDKDDRARVSVICGINNKETILREYSVSFATKLYTEETGEITLNIPGDPSQHCDDSTATVKFLVEGYTNDAFIAVDNVRLYAWGIPTQTPTTKPTLNPTKNPSMNPSANPTQNPSQIPTKIPTMIPTQTPTEKTLNPTPFTLNPSHSPTKGPTFEKQECNDIYIESRNFSLLDTRFKIGDLVGINNHLYWDSDQQYGYRLYFNSSWIILLDHDIQYTYIQNKNSPKTLLDAAGYPPFNRLTSWYLLNNADTNNYIQLYLSCDIDAVYMNVTEKKAAEYTLFVVVGLLLIAMILIFIVFLVHCKKSGSDKPGYISLIRCFAEIADFYTDISFAYLIYLNGNTFIWYLVPILCISFAYILSIFVALYKINKYKKSGESVIINHMKNFDKLWLTLTLIFGFYATFDLLSSHIFHLKITSFQASKGEENNIKTLRIINFVLIENLGMIIIQIIYLSYIGYFNNIYIGDHDISSELQVTLLSMTFGIISIMSGLLTVISRLFQNHHTSSIEGEIKYFHLDISSKNIDEKHTHSHLLIAIAVGKSIKMDQSSVETICIVLTTKGIHSKIAVNISNQYELENYQKLFINSDIKNSLENELKNVLKLATIKDIAVEKIKTNQFERKGKYGVNERQIQYQLSDQDTDTENEAQLFAKIEMCETDRY